MNKTIRFLSNSEILRFLILKITAYVLFLNNFYQEKKYQVLSMGCKSFLKHDLRILNPNGSGFITKKTEVFRFLRGRGRVNCACVRCNELYIVDSRKFLLTGGRIKI